MDKKNKHQYTKNKYERGSKIYWFESIKYLTDNLKYTIAEGELIKFIESYPSDIPGLFEYGKLLFRKYDYENACFIFEKIIREQEGERILTAAYTFLFKCYYKLNRFEDAYRIIDKIFFSDYDISVGTFKSMLELKLNIPVDITTEEGTYAISQEKHYDKERTINHIKRHCKIDYNHLENLVILDKINIEELYSKIEKVLPESKVSDIFSFGDVYYFYYPSFGYDPNKNDSYLDVVKVITIKDTTKIISLFPSYEQPKDINKNLYEETTNNKILRKTQTEKFYDRYNKRG